MVTHQSEPACCHTAVTKTIFSACPLEHTQPLSALLLGLPFPITSQTIFIIFLVCSDPVPSKLSSHMQQSHQVQSLCLILLYHNTCKLPLTGLCFHCLPQLAAFSSAMCFPFLRLLAHHMYTPPAKPLRATKTLHITSLINTLKTYANCCHRFLKEKWSVYIE